jgi:hypothetical protein
MLHKETSQPLLDRLLYATCTKDKFDELLADFEETEPALYEHMRENNFFDASELQQWAGMYMQAHFTAGVYSNLLAESFNAMYKSFDKFGALRLSEVVLRTLVLLYQMERDDQRVHAKFKLEYTTKCKAPDTAVTPFLKDLAAHLGKDAYSALVQALASANSFHSAVDSVLPLLDADDSASVVLRSPDGAPICKLSLGRGCNCNASTNWLLPCAHMLCVLARRNNGLHALTDVKPYVHERWVLSHHTTLPFSIHASGGRRIGGSACGFAADGGRTPSSTRAGNSGSRRSWR